MRSFLLGIVLCLVFTLAKTQTNNVEDFGDCLTPNRERGLCIYLTDCGELIKLVQKKPLFEDELQFLRNSQCGYNNRKVLICCPRRSIGSAATDTPVTSVPQPTDVTSRLLPEPSACTLPTSPKIYGGNRTHIDEYRWMALLEYTKPENKKGFHCGGSLINNRYVLTAAHCVSAAILRRNWRLTGIRLGEWDTSKTHDCELDSNGNQDCSDDPVDVPVESILVHESYNPNAKNQQHDIALIRLTRSVPYTDFIKPICMPKSAGLRDSTFEGVKMDVAGWGRTETTTSSAIKMKATIGVVGLDDCEAVYGPRNIKLVDSQMCAGGQKGIDSCSGDSGGPLIGVDMANKARTYYFLAGVVSFGPTSCGMEGWPGVYTRVGSYVDWIEQNIKP